MSLRFAAAALFCAAATLSVAATDELELGHADTLRYANGFPPDSTQDQPFICDYRRLAWECVPYALAPFCWRLPCCPLARPRMLAPDGVRMPPRVGCCRWRRVARSGLARLVKHRTSTA